VLDDLGIRVPLPAEAEILSSPQRQSGSGVHPAACPMVTWALFLQKTLGYEAKHTHLEPNLIM